mmetsp:Transcript_66706/g.124618  ORF Transcript_66706/g.124618 Transcript_66706/m.124618 type:complete len:284 (+) Transcript_66706:62-913(+)
MEEIGESIPAGVRTGVCDHSGLGRKLILPGPKPNVDTLLLAREAAWACRGFSTPRRDPETSKASPRDVQSRIPLGDMTMATPLTHNQRTHNKEALMRPSRQNDTIPVPPYIQTEICGVAPEGTGGRYTFQTTYYQKMCLPQKRNRPFSAPMPGTYGGQCRTSAQEDVDPKDTTAIHLQLMREAVRSATPSLRVNTTHVGAGGYGGNDTSIRGKHEGWMDDWTTTYRSMLCPGWCAPRKRASSVQRVPSSPKWDGRRPRTVGKLAPKSARRPVQGRGPAADWRP